MDVFNCWNFFSPFPSPHLVQTFDFVHWYSRYLAIRNMALLGSWRGRHQWLSPRVDQQGELQWYRTLPPVTAGLRCGCCGKVSVNYVPLHVSLLTSDTQFATNSKSSFLNLACLPVDIRVLHRYC